MSKGIFDQTVLGGIPLKNRLIRSATWENLVDGNGVFDDTLIPLYAELAKGGIGLIITGFTTVSDADDYFGGMMRLGNDAMIPQFRELVQAVHAFDCPVMPQLALGCYRTRGVDGILRRLEMPEMEHEDIADIVDLFVQAARRAKKAGFDGAQIHAAHGFFLSRSLSPLHNTRLDCYGGSLKNRARLLMEVVDAVREEVGSEFHLSMKINCEDFQMGGLSAPDSRTVCLLAVEHGLDSIEVSGGGASRSGVRAGVNEGYFLSYAVELQSMVDVPVITVGGYRSVECITRVLNEMPLSYVSLSRPLIKEPGLPNRWKAGDRAPSTCISCNACYETPGHHCIFAR